jgi:hypothetical protein
VFQKTEDPSVVFGVEYGIRSEMLVQAAHQTLPIISRQQAWRISVMATAALFFPFGIIGGGQFAGIRVSQIHSKHQQ